ncbi:MAG: hypothetical protein ACE5OZ_10335 [Candidatus Heimdallarchaeota archaeon]
MPSDLEKEAKQALNALGIAPKDILILPTELWLSLKTDNEKWTFGPRWRKQGRGKKGDNYYFEARYRKAGKGGIRKPILHLTQEQWEDPNFLHELRLIYDPPKHELFAELSRLKEEMDRPHQEAIEVQASSGPDQALNKALVLKIANQFPESDIIGTLDSHTIGIVISLFHQEYGPIPILSVPEQLKEAHYDQLIALSDRSFSVTGFSEDFLTETPASYDLVWKDNVLNPQITNIAFGFALKKADARARADNFVLNLLILKPHFQLANVFLSEIQSAVHNIHLLMQAQSKINETIFNGVFELRKLISAIILANDLVISD